MGDMLGLKAAFSAYRPVNTFPPQGADGFFNFLCQWIGRNVLRMRRGRSCRKQNQKETPWENGNISFYASSFFSSEQIAP